MLGTHSSQTEPKYKHKKDIVHCHFIQEENTMKIKIRFYINFHYNY